MEEDSMNEKTELTRVIPRLALRLPDGSREPLSYADVVRYNLKAGSRAPFTRYPVVTFGWMTIHYDEGQKTWVPMERSRGRREKGKPEPAVVIPETAKAAG